MSRRKSSLPRAPIERRSTAAGPGAKRDRALMAKWIRASAALPFGPEFFLTRLAGFVRDRCPTPADGLPVVLVHVSDGEVLDVCHVIGLSRHWVALAVHDERGLPGPPRMRTAVIPYASICRFTLRSEPGEGTRIGFRQEMEPKTFAAGGDGSTSARRSLALAAGSAATPANPLPTATPDPGARHLAPPTRGPAS